MTVDAAEVEEGVAPVAPLAVAEGPPDDVDEDATDWPTVFACLHSDVTFEGVV